MGFFRKKPDPITERARALNAQIAALESQIQNLSAEAEVPAPKFRSSTGPRAGLATALPSVAPRREVASQEHFEKIDHRPLQADSSLQREHYNELGVRKFDLVGAWQRFKNQFRPPPTANPKLVNYLAAGSIHGLRPLRFEKRVARNRFILLVVVLVAVLWGIVAAIFQR